MARTGLTLGMREKSQIIQERWKGQVGMATSVWDATLQGACIQTGNY